MKNELILKERISFILHLSFYVRIRDPGSGAGMKKIQHSGFATLIAAFCARTIWHIDNYGTIVCVWSVDGSSAQYPPHGKTRH
jgi:hypothetical protein